RRTRSRPRGRNLDDHFVFKNSSGCTQQTRRMARSLDLEKGFSDLESRRGTATRITQLTRREQQVVNLFLEGCENIDIARQLGIAHRTVKACLNRLYLRFGITSGIKRVKLATLVYRNQLSSDAILTESRPSPLPPSLRAGCRGRSKQGEKLF